MDSPPLLVYRFGNRLFRWRVPVLPRIISWLNRLVFGCWVPSSARLGNGVVLGYWGIGVVLHSDCEIGEHTLVSQNVTVGRNKKDPGVPRIGCQVYVAAGAVLSGDICIGDGCIIGANAFVNRSIPAGKVAAGVPARILRDTHDREVEQLLGIGD